MKTLLLSVLFAPLLAITSYAQCGDPNVFCMESGLEYTCLGTFMDAGGADVYPPESSTVTLCSDQEGYKMSISFSEFDLRNDWNVLNSDQMIIFDGTSENDPLIGIYSSTDLAGMTISASNGNASGCLMIQFISGGMPNDLYSGWIGELSCFQPCIPPTAVATVLDSPVEDGIYLNCLYDEITLSGSGSTATIGQTIVSYAWDLMDGNTNVSSSSDILHQYESPAIFDVVLLVLDDIGCAGETTIHVGMVGAPALDIDDDIFVCVGAELTLDASFIPSSINNAPQLQNNIALFVPDDQTQSFQTEIMVGGYQSGATVNSCDDLQNVYVNMEHSFMGDLIIKLICPTGQSILLHDQSGGAAYLGEPVDTEDTEAGIGYDYVWSDDSQNTTWAETDIDLGTSTLPAGTYLPVEPLCNLIGCPLNGIWALNIMDQWAIDNGYVFSWGLGMAVGNNVEALEYTTTINADAIQSFWSGSDVISLNENAEEALINTAEIGQLDLAYTTIDNLGCMNTETVNIEVIDNPIDVILDDYFTYDDNNEYLYATTNGTIPEYLLSWTWTPADGISNPNDYFTQVLIPNDNSTYTVTANSSLYLGCSDSETIAMTLPELVVSGHIFYDENQNGIFDTNEETLPNFPYQMVESGMNSFSDQNGYYSSYCTYGTNTVSLTVNSDLWIVTTPTSFSTVLNDNQTKSLNYDFGIYPSSNEQINLNGGISNSNTWCALNDVQTITVSNDGNTIESGYIVYSYDPLCTVVSTDPAPFNVDGLNLYFAFEDLFYSSVASFQVVLDLSNSSAGDVLNFSTQTYYYDNEVAVSLEANPLMTTVICSYDPNDKREMNGVGELGMIAPNTTLDYVIRFQNTGNAPAMDVVITDQLPNTLNYATLDPVASSHPFTATVSAIGLVTFNFNNILLPDSGSNFEGSIGFIHFRINQNSDLAIGTVIHNEASIYFDANAPIITNSTTNTVLECTGQPLNIIVDENEIQLIDLVSNVQWYLDGELLPNVGYIIVATETGNYYATAVLEDGCPATSPEVFISSVPQSTGKILDVFPNPATQVINVMLPSGLSSITLFNQLGQPVKSFNNISGMYEINVSELPRGSYHLRLTNEATIQHMSIILE